LDFQVLDWFSQNRIKGERREDTKRPEPQQVLRDYVFRKPDGGLIALSQIEPPMVIVFLPAGFPTRQTYFVEWLTEKSEEVRSLQTRFVVAVYPEDLYTVVALAGDLLILSDESGEAMLDLGSDSPVFYSINRERQIVRIFEQRELAA
jgi:hypothetical protein